MLIFVSPLVWVVPNKTAIKRRPGEHARGLCDISVIWYSQWRSPLQAPNTLEVFADGPPVVADITRVTDWAQLKSTLTRWTRCVSDVSGCVLLTNPVAAEPVLVEKGFLGSDVPFLCLLQEVERRGWRCADAKHPLIPLTPPIMARFLRNSWSHGANHIFNAC